VTRCALPGDVSGVLLADVRLINAPESASAARRIVKAVACAWGAAAVADRLGWQVLARGKAVYVELAAWPALPK
jgi:hypothetical protein